MKQVNWLDFGDTKSLRNLDKDGPLKLEQYMRRKFRRAMWSNWTETEFETFYATEIYRDRVKGTEYESKL